MPKACVLFKPSVAYRRDAFEAGLRRLGYATVERPLPNPERGDVLVLWNRSVVDEGHARRYEASGATVLVSENGYVGKDEQGHKLFALARGHHNGAGEWLVGSETRWSSSLDPWRSQGDFLLVLPQRGIGERGVAMPRDWVGRASSLLRRLTKRPIRVRPHPGMAKTDPYDALRGAHAAVTWGSGAGIKALLAGVPVFYELSRWIGAPAGTFLGGADLERPFLGDRLPMFRRLAWAQWSLKEIEGGEAFAWLLK